MPVYTIVCPDCGHVSKSFVLKDTRMPTRVDMLKMWRPPRASRSGQGSRAPSLGDWASDWVSLLRRLTATRAPVGKTTPSNTP